MEQGERRQKPELLVTDFGGTVLRDDGVVIDAYRRALTEHEIPFTEDELRARRGANKRAVFAELAGRTTRGQDANTLAERALETFEVVLRDAYAEDAAEIPGAGEAVNRLRERGINVALTTGFERSLVDLLLDKLGWTDLFDLAFSGESVSRGRPAPYMIFQAMMQLGVEDVRQVAVIGDTPLDLAAGMNAGAGWVIGVLSGAHGIETLGATRHTHIIPSIAELPALFEVVD